MSDWNEIINEALRELKADATFTRGAILRNKVDQIAKQADLDLEHHLKETNQKFSSLVEKVENIEIHKRPNTDMYVGLLGARWPDSTENRFRADVYEAFTRISDSDYWYVPDVDEFTKEIAKDDTRKKIAVPSVTLENLLSQRRSFAEDSGAREELLRAIERSPNPLAAFQAAITQLHMGQQWHNYKSRKLRNSIEEWAEQNRIEFSPLWVESQDMERDQRSPQQLLATFATYMTDEEVRSIAVPFRAVEAMCRSIDVSR